MHTAAFSRCSRSSSLASELEDRSPGEIGLRHEAGDRGVPDQVGEIGLGMRRHEDDGHLRVGLRQAPAHVEAALSSEHDVNEGEIGTMLVGLLQRAGRRRGHADHVESLPLEQVRRSVEEGRIVVHDEAAQHGSSVAARAAGRIEASLN
jgi:hypothetical protein